MGNERLPVLWLTGAPGTGKTTTGWGLYTRVAEQGGSVAYVDIDQLGLLGPPPGGGDAAHAIKAGNLLRILDTLRLRGVRQVIVSGVVDPEGGIEPYFAGRDAFDVTLVRLFCARDELEQRFLGRGSPAGALPELFAVADAYHRTGFGEGMDTGGQRPEDTVEALISRCAVAQGPVRELPRAEPFHLGPVVVVTGATAAGKSTAAWSALRELWERGLPVAYIDLAQLGFVHPGPDPALEAANLVAVRRGYRDAGAKTLLVVTRELGSVQRQAFAGEQVTVVHLDADAATLTERVRRRAEGESALLAGDELRGVPPGAERRMAARAVAEAERMRRAGGDRIVLDTTGQKPDETAAALLEVVETLVQ